MTKQTLYSGPLSGFFERSTFLEFMDQYISDGQIEKIGHHIFKLATDIHNAITYYRTNDNGSVIRHSAVFRDGEGRQRISHAFVHRWGGDELGEVERRIQEEARALGRYSNLELL